MSHKEISNTMLFPVFNEKYLHVLWILDAKKNADMMCYMCYMAGAMPSNERRYDDLWVIISTYSYISIVLWNQKDPVWAGYDQVRSLKTLHCLHTDLKRNFYKWMMIVFYVTCLFKALPQHFNLQLSNYLMFNR